MSQQEKAALWRELKDAGIEPPLHYREYSTEQLRAAVKKLREKLGGAGAPEEHPTPPAPPSLEEIVENTPVSQVAAVSSAEPDTMAGLRQNSKDEDEPIRVDEKGRIWYQDEVRKPSMPTPRARRVLKYNDPGVKEMTVGDGRFTERFEVPGDQSVPSEIKITMPSYQEAIYRDPRFPFKIHEYNGQRGFDLFEVRKFYGGPDLVPRDIKRVYVQNVLCYDIPSTIRAIQAEARERGILKGI